MHTDVGALEGVAELCVVQLADGARQVLWRVKLHNTNDAAAVAEDVHIVGRAHLPEVVLCRSRALKLRTPTDYTDRWERPRSKRYIAQPTRAYLEPPTSGLTGCRISEQGMCQGRPYLEVLPRGRHGQALDHDAVRTALGTEVGRGHWGRAPSKGSAAAASAAKTAAAAAAAAPFIPAAAAASAAAAAVAVEPSSQGLRHYLCLQAGKLIPGRGTKWPCHNRQEYGRGYL